MGRVEIRVSAEASKTRNHSNPLKCVLITEWPQTGHPSKSRQHIDDLTISLNDTGNDALEDSTVQILNNRTGIKYRGHKRSNESEDGQYLVGVRKGNSMTIYPGMFISMKPSFIQDEKNDEKDIFNRSFRERVDEFNEKFGSKQTKRQIETKRKYALSSKEDDLKDIGEEAHHLIEKKRIKKEEESLIKSSPNQNKHLTSNEIIPPRNELAKKREEVYNLNDIISETELEFLTSEFSSQFQTDDTLISFIQKEFVKLLFQTSCRREENGSIDESTRKSIAVYLDFIITLIQLRYKEWHRADPVPQYTNFEVKELILNKYTEPVLKGKFMRRLPSPKQKDRLISHSLILSFALNGWEKIEVDSIFKALKVPLTTLKNIATAVGCHLETIPNEKGINSKYFTFKLPLNILKPFKGRGKN